MIIILLTEFTPVREFLTFVLCLGTVRVRDVMHALFETLAFAVALPVTTLPAFVFPLTLLPPVSDEEVR